MYFISMKDVELLQKSGKYLVLINFTGHVFRKDNWYVVYKTSNIDEAKRYIDVFTSLIASRNSASRCGGAEVPGKSDVSPAKTPVATPINLQMTCSFAGTSRIKITRLCYPNTPKKCQDQRDA